jgi:hypothetical protein
MRAAVEGYAPANEGCPKRRAPQLAPVRSGESDQSAKGWIGSEPPTSPAGQSADYTGSQAPGQT